MGIGAATQSGVTAAINTTGSSVIITPYTISSSDGGYSGQEETDGTSVTEVATPFGELKKITKLAFGDVEIGGLQLALKSTAVFDISGDTKYKITYNDEVYDIAKQKRFYFANSLVAWIITLSKRID